MNFAKYFLAFLAAATMAFITGCASGGYKLTRQYAQFVNRQHIIIRIVLYVLTLVVFAVTMLIDVVLNNTMDFWEGRVSEGTYRFHKEDRVYVAHHSKGADGLRRSHFEVFDKKSKKLQDIVLAENTQGEVELFVDGLRHSRVSNIRNIPLLSSYDASGAVIRTRDISAALGQSYKVANH